MAEQEYNLGNQVGVKPAYDMDSLRVYPRQPSLADQVLAYSSIENATTTIYTVPADTTLHLCAITAAYENISGGAGRGHAYIRDDDNNLIYSGGVVTLLDDVSMIKHYTFNPPMILSSGYYITGKSFMADMVLRLSMYGYEF